VRRKPVIISQTFTKKIHAQNATKCCPSLASSRIGVAWPAGSLRGSTRRLPDFLPATSVDFHLTSSIVHNFTSRRPLQMSTVPRLAAVENIPTHIVARYCFVPNSNFSKSSNTCFQR